MKKNACFYLREIAVAMLICTIISCAQPPFKESLGHIKPIQTQSELENLAIPKPVYKAMDLPEPDYTLPEERMTVVVHDIPVKELLFALARDAKKNIDISPDMIGNVSLNAIDQTLKQILERLKRQIDLRYKEVGETLVITPDTPYFVQYKVPYINLTRLSNNQVSIATQVASTGSGAGSDDSGGDSGSSNSATQVSSSSIYMFWETLLDNIRGILRDQDSLRNFEQEIGSSEEGSNDGPLDNNIIAHQETGIVAVKASEKKHAEIRKYINNVLYQATRQVLIEATIVEVELNDNYQTGIDWSVLADEGRFSLSNNFENLVIGATPAVTPAALAIQGQDILASIRLLDTFGNSRVLSSPKLMVLNNQTAILKVVENTVYFTTSAQTDTTQGVATTTFETALHTVPVGLVMTVNPQIAQNDEVIINARPTISRVVSFVNDPHPELARLGIESRIPQVEVREMESILKIASGNIGVIGGLMQNKVENLNEGTPGLSRMEFFDNIFSYKSKQSSKTELVIFFRPRVIKSASVQEDLMDFNHFLENKPVHFDVPEFK